MMCSAGRGFHICQGKLGNCFPIHNIRAPDTQYRMGQRSQMESRSSSSLFSSKLNEIKGDIFPGVKNILQLNTSSMFNEIYFAAIRMYFIASPALIHRSFSPNLLFVFLSNVIPKSRFCMLHWLMVS